MPHEIGELPLALSRPPPCHMSVEPQRRRSNVQDDLIMSLNIFSGMCHNTKSDQPAGNKCARCKKTCAPRN